MKISMIKRLALAATAICLATTAYGETPDTPTINYSNFDLTSYRLETNDCFGCGAVDIQSAEDLSAYLTSTRATINARRFNPASFANFANSNLYKFLSRFGPQVVYLDFDAGGEPTFPVCIQSPDGGPDTLFGIFNDHVYTQEERNAILWRVKKDYAKFNFIFTQHEPRYGDFSTISIGDNDAPLDCSEGSNISLTATGGISVLFGQADAIDFGNVNKSNTAFADASIWEFLGQFRDGLFFEDFANIDVAADFDGDLNAAISFAVIGQTANTGSHELGHTVGLRHQNSFGAPGDGIPNTGAISPFDFVPVFEGPSNADETILHTMASGASVGLPFDGGVNMDRFFSERSATRLAVNQAAHYISTTESRTDRYHGRVRLNRIYVPNTIEEGQNENARLKVKAKIIDGEISEIGDTDSYTFYGRKGEFFNAEIIPLFAQNDQTFEEGILGQLKVYQVNYDGTETLIGENARSFESLFDTEIFDIVLPANGRYRVEIAAPNEVFIADFDGDGIIDGIPLDAAGAPELQVGKYKALFFTCDKRTFKKRYGWHRRW